MRDSHLTIPFAPFRLRHWHVLLLILLVSFLLRLLLIANGGQLYWPDERRYWKPTTVADKLYAGDYKNVIASLLKYRTHGGMTSAGLIPAYLHRLAFEAQDNGGVSWHDYWRSRLGDYRLSAVFFAIPSVLSIGMVYLIGLKAGGNKDEALLAAFFLATSNSWFIYSRHFLSLDFSMLLGLVALYAALCLRNGGIKSAVLIGVLMFCAFWIYYSHYFFMFAIAFLYCVMLARRPLDLVTRPIGILIGALLLLGPILLFNYLNLEIDVFAEMHSLGMSIAGDYDEGILLPFLYFGDAEGLISLVWLTGLVAVLALVRRQRPDHRHRAILWLSCLALLYLSMSLFSSGLHILALAGRFVRPMAPFMVLVCAFAFAPVLKRLGFKISMLLLLAVCVLSAGNFLAAINQRFYLEVAKEVLNEYDSVLFGTTFLPPAKADFFVEPKRDDVPYILVNAGFYHPVTEMRDRPEGRVILEVSHPFNYRPFQYESWNLVGSAREIIRRDAVYIWLIDTQAASDGET